MSNTRSITPGATQAARAAELSDKLEGYPLRGIQANGTFSSKVPATWNVTGAVPYGWTSYRAAVEGTSYHGCHGRTWVTLNTSAPNLTPAERTELIGLLATARRFGSRFNVRFW